ncbi:MAG TPA: heavy metal-responsive transcriptional regulator [Nitriliruptorales bacterium]|nr:heavy metal-responsive transcriptional regulator [Nitriliruptorales bacterium]
MSGEMTVSELAQRAGTTADTIRYYERIGLLPEADRSPAGYRLFTEEDTRRVAFVKRAQRFGLQLDEIRQLLDIRERGLCPCGHARDLLTEKLIAIDEQIEALARLRDDIRVIIDDGEVAGGQGCWPCGPQLVQIRPGVRRRP